QSGALVHPGQQHVQRPARRGARGAGVDPADGVVDVAGEGPRRPGDEEDHRGHGRAHREDEAAPPGFPARHDPRHQPLLRGRRSGPPSSRAGRRFRSRALLTTTGLTTTGLTTTGLTTTGLTTTGLATTSLATTR